MADRAERERHYRRLAADASRDEASLALQSRRFSRARLAVFLIATGLLIAGTLGRTGFSRSMVTAAVSGYVLFGIAVFLHARVENERSRAIARRECAGISLARMARRWTDVPAVPAGMPGLPLANARAGDLDVDGEGSMMSLAGALTGAAGRTILRGWLIDPPQDASRIRARQDAARALARSADFREAFVAEMRLYGKHRDNAQSRERFLVWAESAPSALSRAPVRWTVRIATAAILTSVAGAMLTDAAWTKAWFPLALAAFAASIASAKWVHAQLDAASIAPSALSNIVTLITLAEAVPGESEDLEAVRARLSEPVSASSALGSLGRRVSWSELRTAPILHLPAQALTLWDFHVLFALDDWRAAHGGRARAWLDALAELDALVALGSLAHDEPAWTFPLIDEGAPPNLKAQSLGHPLLADDRRVTNDVALGPPGTVLLVTGSNMAGKSTLLRTIGTNVLLANAGAPVCASRMSLTRLAVATSLHTADSLVEGVSGYMAGLMRLKAIVDEVDEASRLSRGGTDLSVPAVLYLLDEILGGTNSEERRIAVAGIARHLLDSHAIGAMTTHDLALADEPALRWSAVRVHFRETVEPDPDSGEPRMSFDYVLRPGIATSTNAIALLRAIGLARERQS